MSIHRRTVPAFLLLLILCWSVPLSAQEAENERANTRSVYDERRDVLRFGIDSEVVGLLSTIREEEYTELNGEILELLLDSRDTGLRTAAIETLTAFEYRPVLDAVVPILEEYPEDEKLVTASLQALIDFEVTDRRKILRDYAEDSSTPIASKAVEALGELGGEDEIEFLHRLYEDEATPQSVKASVLSALGSLGDGSSVPFLAEILTDTTRDRSFRWRACQALGEIGTEEALEPVLTALDDGDTILRTYAVRALRNFDYNRVDDYFIEALRDSFWRVRLAAVETLGERREKNAVEILEYKARRDPEEKIRLAAIEALAKVGGGKAVGILQEIAADEGKSLAMRSMAIHRLAETALTSSFATFDTIIEKEWPRENSRLFIELVKALTSAENPALAKYYEKFLSHPEVSVVLMALKGIERNRFGQFRARLEELSEARTASSIKSTAASVLDSL